MLRFCNSDSAQDVLVTGTGLVTPLGCSAAETWSRLIDGDRAGRYLTRHDIDHHTQLSGIQGLRLNGAPVDHMEVVRRLLFSSVLRDFPTSLQQLWASEPLVAMSLLTLNEAWMQSGLPPELSPSSRLAVVYGSSKGGLRTAELLSLMSTRKKGDETVRAGLPSDVRGRLWSTTFSTDAATSAIAAVSRPTAGVSCPVAACATGLISILQGAAMIHAGLCDVCIVGSADAGLRASVMSSFHRLRVTSRHENPRTACRPFDESRDGFLIGEGAGTLILESRQHAEARRAVSLARVTAGGWLSDPTGITQIDVSGEIVEQILRRTDVAATLRPDVISVHGTGTQANDLAEARGIERAFGDNSPLCFAVKGAMGHLLGAAGSVESILTILTLKHQAIPGTANLLQQDPRCRIRCCAAPDRTTPIQRAAKLSLGFGGHVACGVFDKDPSHQCPR